MTAIDFINKQIQKYDHSRLTGITFREASWDKAGICWDNIIPGKVSIYVYDCPYLPYKDPEVGWIRNREEYRVFLTGHEVFHWLCFTKQLKIAHTERNADLFGRRWLWKYRLQRLLSLIV